MLEKVLNMQYLIVLCLLSAKAMEVRTITATHWMVTETGFIQPKLESPFQMNNPHDLLAFLNQDIRWHNIINLYHDLSKRQTVLDTQWAEIERGDYVKTIDTHCVTSGILNTSSWYYAVMEDGKSKNINDEEFFMVMPKHGEDVLVPDCKKISPLIYSMYAFDDLNSTSGRLNLTIEPEKNIPFRTYFIMNVNQFGHWLTMTLRENTTSWLHYNMASHYWRVKGNAHKAVECSRRAIHHCPIYYRAIPLLNMGMILHRSKQTEDAIKVLSAALEHDPQFYLTHFILANALAVLGDYSNSLIHYDLTLRYNPAFAKAEKYKNDLLCCMSLMKNIISARTLMAKLKINLKEYLQREAYFIMVQVVFFKTMRHEREHGMMSEYFTNMFDHKSFDYDIHFYYSLKDFRNIEKNSEKMTELTGLNMKKLKKDGEKYALILYYVESPMYNNRWLTENGVLAVEYAVSLYKLVKHIQKNVVKKSEYIVNSYQKITDGTVTEEIGPMPLFGNTEAHVDNSKKEPSTPKAKQTSNAMSEFETGIFIYPQTMKVNRNREDFDKDPDWPSVKFCKDYGAANVDKVEAIYPVFMPFENKGIRLPPILSDRIGTPVTKEFELPWHPPSCNSKDGTTPTLKKGPKNPLVNEVIATDYLNKKLLEYVGDGDPESVKHMQEAEIGQRIYSAMKKNVAPRWILYTLSSLYWRVRGNNNNALICLTLANKVVNNKYKDLVLASMASVYLEIGNFDESLSAAEEAFKLNMYEPATNFILAELNMIKTHKNTQLFHLKQVVRVDPAFMDGLARNLLNSWACINDFTRHANVMKEMASIEKVACSGDSEINIACNGDEGGDCKTNVQCLPGREKGMTSVVKTIEKNTALDDLIDENTFSSIINKMPAHRTDKGDHEINYENLLRKADYIMMGCGPHGCRSMTAEDLELKHSDCLMQYMQLGYWLHVVAFRHTLEDPSLRLPSEIETVTPNNAKKFPECRLFTDPATDFFLSRMMRVDTEGWEPDLSLMHQYTEIYEHADYVTLGAKLAKYLTERPQSWRVLLAAGWWCGAGGRGACAVQCLAAAYSHAPKHLAIYAPRSLAALLYLHSKLQDAKDMAYLAFYTAPTNKQSALVAAIIHSFLNEYDQAVWMYRYAMKFDSHYLPAKACLHATMCHMIYPELSKDDQ